jgi:hypothetical protein
MVPFNLTGRVKRNGMYPDAKEHTCTHTYIQTCIHTDMHTPIHLSIHTYESSGRRDRNRNVAVVAVHDLVCVLVDDAIHCGYLQQGRSRGLCGHIRYSIRRYNIPTPQNKIRSATADIITRFQKKKGQQRSWTGSE